MPKDNPKIQKRTYPRLLRCDLTDTEKLARAKDMADAQERGERAKDELDSIRKQINAQIEAASASVAAAAAVLRAGYEHRQIMCELTMDYRTNTAIEIRQDTGEETERRPLSEDERQMMLEGIEE